MKLSNEAPTVIAAPCPVALLRPSGLSEHDEPPGIRTLSRSVEGSMRIG